MNRSFPAVLRPDPFLVLLVATVLLASLLPVRGQAADIAGWISDAAVALLFFLHGAKLSRQAIVAGIRVWPVHLAVLFFTFVAFPVWGLVARAVSNIWFDPIIGDGLLLLCLMPSTVQSSIAFTSLARGNVPAAVCSASASNVLGVFITPLLATILLDAGQGSGGGTSFDTILKICMHLLLPFAVGHLARPLLRDFLARYKGVVSRVDRGAILTVVYTAFSAAVVEGIWTQYGLSDLAWTMLAGAVILALALWLTFLAARLLKFSRANEIVLVFCGSKKSLASGVPIASALFPAAMVGPLILPLMLFHQMQLMACAIIANRYAAMPDPAESGRAVDAAA